jgi:hypothetical protein
MCIQGVWRGGTLAGERSFETAHSRPSCLCGTTSANMQLSTGQTLPIGRYTKDCRCTQGFLSVFPGNKSDPASPFALSIGRIQEGLGYDIDYRLRKKLEETEAAFATPLFLAYYFDFPEVASHTFVEVVFTKDPESGCQAALRIFALLLFVLKGRKR